MDLSYPPFEMTDDRGQPAGISVELAQALGRHLGRPVEIRNIPFAGLIEALRGGRVDLVISSMTATPERAMTIAFSDPYLRTGLAVLTRSANGVVSAEDLKAPGRRIAVRQGTTAQVYARDHLPRAELITLDKEGAAVMEVLQGRADAFLYDQMSVFRHARQHPAALRALLHPLREESWAVGIRQGDDILRGQVNEFLRVFREAGGFEQLGDRHLADIKQVFAEQGVPFVF
jgi:polar amino acid transport system substrate-binding protein